MRLLFALAACIAAFLELYDDALIAALLAIAFGPTEPGRLGTMWRDAVAREHGRRGPDA